MRISITGLAAALLVSGAALAQETELQVELMGPLGTKTSHRGDRVYGRVVEPGGFRGDMVEGVVQDVRSGGKLRGNSVLNFSFETLRHGAQTIAINTQVKSFQNSQGQADVDEEGRIVRKGGGQATKALAGTAAGGLIGGLAGGLKGAAIGAGAGAAASIAIIEITCDSPEIRFAPGSIVTVTAKSRGGEALPGLAAAPDAVAPAEAPPTAAAAAPVPPPAPRPVPQAAPDGPAQPNLVALKADFVPGEKTLFFDDFTDMLPDEAPPHWKVRGSSLSLKQGGGIRQATATDRVQMTPLLTTFPKNFTVETEVQFDNPADLRSLWNFFPKGSESEALQVWIQTYGETSLIVKLEAGPEELADVRVPVNFSQPVREALWVQNGRVRLYINGRRVADANQVNLPALATAQLATEIYGEGSAVGYRSVRIAESTPDFSRSILSTGRYVTYGILFDTDSDRLQAESAGVIQSIAAGLRANPDLKLRIEGHTDSTGSAARNLDLSRRRAEAVKSILASQFQIDPGRLAAEGLGASRPVGSNGTPQGRAENRRVEFVRQ